MPRSREAVDEPEHERQLRADDDEVGALGRGGRDQPVDVVGARRRSAARRRRCRRCRGRRAARAGAPSARSARTSACSRPPEPTTRIRMSASAATTGVLSDRRPATQCVMTVCTYAITYARVATRDWNASSYDSISAPQQAVGRDGRRAARARRRRDRARRRRRHRPRDRDGARAAAARARDRRRRLAGRWPSARASACPPTASR